MTETREYIGFGDVEKFLVKSYKRITGGREFDIDKYGPYIDGVRNVLVPSLEKQILFCLERFVYNENFQQSAYQPCFNRCKESVLTAYAKYNEIGHSFEEMRDSLTIDYLVDFFGHSFLNNTRLARLGDNLDAMGIEKNFLGYVNVFNYINEKDFWVRSASSSDASRECNSICSFSNEKILSEINAEKDSHVVTCLRGHKRPRKRAATHMNRKHYKLEQLAQLSEKSFRVTESLYDLLKSSWDLNDSVHTTRKLKRDCDNLRQSSFANYRRINQKTDWKDENLMFFIKKLNKAGSEIEEGNKKHKNSEARTFLSLPCKLEQLICKLDGINPPSTRSNCRSIKKKFQTKLYNVCSCLNNSLSRMNVKMINSIYLVCEIRKDYLNFKLKQTPASKCNSNLFSARVLTCEGLYRFGIRKTDSRQMLKSANSRASKRANEQFDKNTAFEVLNNPCGQNENKDSAKDKLISSIEISFTMCEDGTRDKHSRTKGLTCDPQDLEGLIKLRDSSSINDVVQKLELSPFRLEETEQSFRIRSKIQDIVRSIMICTQENAFPGREDRQSISIQATVSTSSFSGIKHDAVVSIETKSSKALSVSNIVSKIFSTKSKHNISCNECANKLNECLKSEECTEVKKKLITQNNFLKAGKSGTKILDNSQQKFPASYSSRESPKLMNKNKNKICTGSEKPRRSEEFTRSHRRPLSKNMVESIASEISNVIARTKLSSTGSVLAEDESDFDIDVTVEIEDSSMSSDSISRHTHLLPSMKSVKLGTCSKYFRKDREIMQTALLSSSSSSSEIQMQDNFTTMNKSMTSSSRRGTISVKSYDRIKHLIKEKVCKKLSETESCEPNSSKTIVSGGKYYLSIPSSKTSRVRLRREISDSSSTSNDSLMLHRRKNIQRTLSSDDESVFSKSSDCYADSENNTESSRAATIDKNSTYGCVDDRLANRYFSEIVDDYADETGDSPRCDDVKSHISYEKYSDDEKETTGKCIDCEVSSDENESRFYQVFEINDDEHENHTRSKRKKLITRYVLGKSMVDETPELNDHKRFDKIDRIRRVSGWSTCAVGSSSSIECREIYRSRSNDRGDSQQHKSFAFDPLKMIKKYKKRFKNVDKNLRAKLQQYVDFFKNAKNNLQKQICLENVYETSRTSISSNDFKSHKYSGACFNG